MKKKSQFEKFFPKKSNAAIKEGFRQEKKKWKKEREEYFIEKKRSQRSEARNLNDPQLSNSNRPGPAVRAQTSNEQMPLNKFIAHSGVCSRRDAAEIVKHRKYSCLIFLPGKLFQ